MPRKSTAQTNIRSDYVRERVRQLAAETGKTTTQVLEEAVRAYKPESPADDVVPAGMMRKGKFLVFKSRGRTVTLEDTNRAIWEGRERDLWGYDEV